MLNFFTRQSTRDLYVTVDCTARPISLTGDFGEIQVAPEEFPAVELVDFAVWLLLPVAMRVGANLKVHGAGHRQTLLNAETMSQIWSCWLPGHFSNVSVSFDEAINEGPTGSPSHESNVGGLHFYSGGIDSTASIIRNRDAYGDFDLLTVHGMDYDVGSVDQFQRLIAKTNQLCNALELERKVTRHNAYSVYEKFRCNPKGHHVTHIFALTGAAFLFLDYHRYFIASDRRLDQQFAVHPWGSNTGSNRYFSDGSRALETLDDDVTRAQKMPIVASHDSALRAITVCDNKQLRPENCGKCSKCTRTKVMFFVANGSVPEIFSDMSLDRGWVDQMNLKKVNERAFFFDIISTGRRSGYGADLPGFQEACKLAT